MNFPSDYPDRKVCVMGLGYVGLTLATVMADVGFQVTGVEIREDVLEKLRRGEPHFHEPGLADKLRRVVGLGRLEVEQHIPKGDDSRVYIITVGTPLSSDRKARMDMIANVSREVAQHMNAGDMVVMRSTVKIGTTRNVVVPILDSTGLDYDLAFCPERTLEGQALLELRRLPQIVGGVTPRANVRAAQLFMFLTPTVVRVSNVETAEMIKLVDNAQRDVQFAYANEVARLCDAIGISAAEVISAGRRGYPRTNLPMPGPVGGPCLEKDSYILSEGLEALGVRPDITMTARALNEQQIVDVAQHLASVATQLSDMPAKPVVTVAGLAFKGRPATDDLRGTTARPLVLALKAAFPSASFRGYDPVVGADGIRSLGLEPTSSLEEAYAGTNLLIIHNNHPCFSNMSVEKLADAMARPGIIYDFWNHFSSRDLQLPVGTGYMALGSHGWFKLAESSGE